MLNSVILGINKQTGFIMQVIGSGAPQELEQGLFNEKFELQAERQLQVGQDQAKRNQNSLSVIYNCRND